MQADSMELPRELKDLYRHWPHHTESRSEKLEAKDVFANERLFEEIIAFVRERMQVWERKQEGKEPYTSDPIISKYRFCNMLREFDRQTIEFHTLLNPLREDFPLWLLNMFYCRMVARTQTVRDVGLLSFDPAANAELQERLEKHVRPKYGTPYVFPVSVILRSATPTRESFIAQYLPKVMRSIAEEILPWQEISVVEGVSRVLPLFGYNLAFLWTEVLIDTAYQYPDRIGLYKEFPVGPGSQPTFKRINTNVPLEELAKQLGQLGVASGVTYGGKDIILSAENWEGVGCEFRKYTNLKAGKGRKRLYTAG